MEENLRRSLLISDGSWSFLWDRPLTICIMITILLIIFWQIYNSYKSKKNRCDKNITKKVNKISHFLKINDFFCIDPKFYDYDNCNSTLIYKLRKI